MNGHAVNIFFDVYDFDIDIRNGNYYKITLIPLRNIGLIEFFPKSLIIGRTGMKDIKVNVNGGKYDND